MIGCRWTRLGLRGRLMLIGLLGVAGALVIGGLLLYMAMSTTLARGAESAAQTRASEVAALVNQGRLPDPVPVAGAEVVQVLDADNLVVGGSLNADRLTPLVSGVQRATLTTGRTVTVAGSRAAMSGQLLVAGASARVGDAAYLVVAAVPTADQEASRRLLARLLLVFFPLVLAALGAVAWRVIGSSLAPVEEMRAAAEAIEERSLGNEQLPVPATRDELAALANTLNGMLDRLAAARGRQRAFVADAAHELRSPLTSLRAQLDVARHLGEGGDLPADLLPDVDRLERLVEDLLLLARSSDNPAAPSRQRLDLGALLVETASRYAAARVPVTIVAHRLDAGPFVADPVDAGPFVADRVHAGPVAVDRVDAGPFVVGERTELARALTNLVDNAVRHARTRVELASMATPTGPGEKSLATETAPEADARAAKAVAPRVGTGTQLITVTISDDGHGIPEADRERVFGRFTRLDEARDRDGGGSGLGLSIVRELLHRNGARVHLEDAQPGVRAVVTFPLPATHTFPLPASPTRHDGRRAASSSSWSPAPSHPDSSPAR